jgi:hypothetical protein
LQLGLDWRSASAPVKAGPRPGQTCPMPGQTRPQVRLKSALGALQSGRPHPHLSLRPASAPPLNHPARAAAPRCLTGRRLRVCRLHARACTRVTAWLPVVHATLHTGTTHVLRVVAGCRPGSAWHGRRRWSWGPAGCMRHAQHAHCAASDCARALTCCGPHARPLQRARHERRRSGRSAAPTPQPSSGKPASINPMARQRLHEAGAHVPECVPARAGLSLAGLDCSDTQLPRCTLEETSTNERACWFWARSPIDHCP